MKSIKSKEVAVLLIGPFNDTFDYLIEENINEISPGQIVLAPFRQRKVVGIILSEGSKTVSKSKLKTVIDIYELDPIPLPTIDLISCSWFLISPYTISGKAKFIYLKWIIKIK